MIDPTDPATAAILVSARNNAAAFQIALKALSAWDNVHRQMYTLISQYKTAIVAGLESPAGTAKWVRSWGLNLFTQVVAINVTTVTPALAVYGGFTADEVSTPLELYLQLCEALRDTPADGSGLSALFATLAAVLAPPVSLN